MNFFDLAVFGALWGTNQTVIEDLNGDDKVDIYDLDVFCIEWLKQD